MGSNNGEARTGPSPDEMPVHERERVLALLRAHPERPTAIVLITGEASRPK